MIAGVGAWQWHRQRDRVSRRHFVAMLAAGGLSAATGRVDDGE